MAARLGDVAFVIFKVDQSATWVQHRALEIVGNTIECEMLEYASEAAEAAVTRYSHTRWL